MNEISIVGGGATGAATLIALLKKIRKNKFTQKTTINIFEPKSDLGLGLVYSASLTSILLNTSVGCTTIIANDNRHFANWLEKQASRWKPLFPEVTTYNLESFLPRALCGLYIKDTLNDELSYVNKDIIQINHIRQKVTDIKLTSALTKRFTVFTTSGSYTSDSCVLATGYGQGYSSTYPYLTENKNYFSSPYLCIEQIQKIHQRARILIIGTGLSAIDAALILKNRNYSPLLATACQTGVNDQGKITKIF